jgi:O-antigen/teichoic acid export membrane protein
VATAAGNGLAYIFTITMSRLLGADGFGALGTLLGVWVIAQVPAVAWQLTVARAVAAGPVRVRRYLSLGVRLGLLITSLMALGAWPLAVVLHVGVAAVLWLAAGQLPTMMLFACLGVAQGRSRFGAYGVVLAGFHLVRLVAGVAAALAGLGTTGVLAATFVAASCAAAAGWVATFGVYRDAPDVPLAVREWIGPLLRGTASMGALLVLTTTDLLLAGHYLTGDARGVYASGNVMTRAAFWGPQFIGMFAYPSMSRPAQRDRARRLAVVAVAALGLAGMLLVLVAGPLVVRVVFGPDYASLAPLAPLFVLVGAAAAVLNVVLLDDVATGRAIGTRLSYGAVLLETLLVAVWWHDRPAAVVGTAAVVCAATAVLAVLLTTRAAGSARHPVAEPVAGGGPLAGGP